MPFQKPITPMSEHSISLPSITMEPGTPMMTINPGQVRSRSGSPSPGLLPTPVSSCFTPERSFSGVSSMSSQSSISNESGTRSASFSTNRRRGYIRPQGVTFAQSAKNRDSVMSLGSIAHLQYYFARTGLLDGKGGQLAKKKETGEYDIPRLSLGSNNSDVVESPIDEEVQLLWEAAQEDGHDVMLPPTVSTYSHKPIYVPPPPDQKTMKKDLVDALENALHALEASDQDASSDEAPTPGFYEIQGLHILDTTTLAIRAARIYYTSHPNPARLHLIRSDQQIRKDLYGVMEVLKNVAERNFAGGLHEGERLAILVWVSEVGMMIDQEAKMEEAEKSERENWHWMDNSRWEGKDIDREINFLEFLSDKYSNISEAVSSQEPTPSTLGFFKALGDGRKLCHMHNVAIQRSKKQFGQIKTWHEDVAKPYRRADNLRYWIKAAEIRWEIKLKLDVMTLVSAADDSEIWGAFQDVVLQWSRGVREELSKDWNGEEERKLHARAKSLGAKSLAMSSSPHGSPSKKKASVSSIALPVDL